MKMPPVNFDVIQLKGGMDIMTPTLILPSGVSRDALNYEVSMFGGNTRIIGDERFDGRPSPSNALATNIYIGTFTNIPTIGQTLTGQTSGATGIIVSIFGSYLVIT